MEAVHGSMLLVFAAIAIALLILLITRYKVYPFLVLIIVSLLLGLASGMPIGTIVKSFETGNGNTLGHIAIVVGLGTMLGKMMAESGGAERIATTLIDFFGENRGWGFLALGSVFLVVTGGETLYAHIGHFGPRPIRLTWFVVVLPALLLNYFGQGALLLQNPAHDLGHELGLADSRRPDYELGRASRPDRSKCLLLGRIQVAEIFFLQQLVVIPAKPLARSREHGEKFFLRGKRAKQAEPPVDGSLCPGIVYLPQE